IFKHMAEEPHPAPAWIVCGPGTGGTSAPLGRSVRYRRHGTKVLCADPEHSAFCAYARGAPAGRADPSLALPGGARIEGLGRPRVEASFIPSGGGAMARVPRALSLAAMRHVSAGLGRRVGGSTGTNFVGVLRAAQPMREAGQGG